MVCMVSRFTRIYGTQIKKTDNMLNKNIDTNFFKDIGYYGHSRRESTPRLSGQGQRKDEVFT